jgi:hypothetical protein
MAAADASSPDDGYRGPGLMGLSPYVGDQILLTEALLPGLRHPHWFRVTKLTERPDGRLELAGYPLARDDLGEVGIGEPVQVPGPLTALFGVPEPTPLPPSVESALAHPDVTDDLWHRHR